MPDPPGRTLPLSLPRKWIADLLHASRGVPLVTFERRMMLADVIAARAGCDPRPAWTAIFAKAYSTVAAGMPELRRAYVVWPWPHLYESDASVASVAVAREYQGEPAVFFGLLSNPDARPLAELTQHLRDWQTLPVEKVRPFAKLIRYTKLPRTLRRFAWWHGMHWSGRLRAKNFGTFGLSVTAADGACAVSLLSPLATSLSYGPFADDGSLVVRLHFDHRVLDGRPAAAALAELERVLTTAMVAEMRRG